MIEGGWKGTALTLPALCTIRLGRTVTERDILRGFIGRYGVCAGGGEIGRLGSVIAEVGQRAADFFRKYASVSAALAEPASHLPKFARCFS
jgi:hypothetical protein